MPPLRLAIRFQRLLEASLSVPSRISRNKIAVVVHHPLALGIDQIPIILGWCSARTLGSFWECPPASSNTSSNSRSLRQVAQGHGTRAFLIDGPENITDEMVAGAQNVGVTAGASAPEEIVQAVIEDLRQRGASQVEEFVLREEDVEFRVPPGLV